MIRVPDRHTWPAFSVLGDDRLRGGVEVGVGEHDERRLATEFEADRCECLGSRRRPIERAVGVEPVKLIRSMSACATSAAPAVLADALHDVEHTVGKTRFGAELGKEPAVSGAHSGGLTTMVLPAAKAGPTFHVVSMNGAFHGVMSAATPLGSNRTRLLTSGGLDGLAERERFSAKNEMLARHEE